EDVRFVREGPIVDAFRFSGSGSEWKARRGEWTMIDGVYRQTSLDEDCRAILDDPAVGAVGDCTIDVRARKLGGDEGFLVMFHVRDDENFYWWNVGGWGNREHGIEKCVDGSKIQLGPHVAGSIEAGRWYDLQIAIDGPHIRCYLDGQLVHDVI